MQVKSKLLLAALAICILPAHAKLKSANQQSEKTNQKVNPMAQPQNGQQKIKVLEDRLEALESQMEENTEQSQAVAVQVSQQGNRRSPSTFNPSIGVILNGKLMTQSADQSDFSIPGFFLGEEPGPGEPGFSLGESELNLAANVDDKFYASMTLAFGEETEVEEAYLQTTSLPNALQLKFGQFFSSVGYLNSRHAHSDDFAYRPLAYQTFLGKNFGDAGVQLRWLAPTDLYWESGIEIYRGDSFPAAGAAKNGKGVNTFFSHIGGDLGVGQSWRAGLSFLTASVDERSSDEIGSELFSGNSDLWIADFIWKWSPNGNNKITNAKIQAEFFQRHERGEVTDINAVAQSIDSHQNGWYVQGVYQFMPQWRVGMRYELLKSDDLPASFAGSVLDNLNRNPKQTSVMLDWSNSEFSRVRLQFSRDQAAVYGASLKTNNLWTLQYIAAFGAHGAHSF